MRQNPILFGFNSLDQLSSALGLHLPDYQIDPERDVVVAARTCGDDQQQTTLLAFMQGPQLTLLLDRAYLWEGGGVTWDPQPTTAPALLLQLREALGSEDPDRAQALLGDVRAHLEALTRNERPGQPDAALVGFTSLSDVWSLVDTPGFTPDALTVRAAYKRRNAISERYTVILLAEHEGVLHTGVTVTALPGGLHEPRRLTVTLVPSGTADTVEQQFTRLLFEHQPESVALDALRQYRAEAGLERDARFHGLVGRLSELRRLTAQPWLSDTEVLFATCDARHLRVLLRQGGELRRMDVSAEDLARIARDGYSDLYAERTTLRAFTADLPAAEQQELLGALEHPLLAHCA